MQKTLRDLAKKAEKDPAYQWASDLAAQIVCVADLRIDGIVAAQRGVATVANILHDCNDALEDAVRGLSFHLDSYRREMEKHNRLVARIKELAETVIETPSFVHLPEGSPVRKLAEKAGEADQEPQFTEAERETD